MFLMDTINIFQIRVNPTVIFQISISLEWLCKDFADLELTSDRPTQVDMVTVDQVLEGNSRDDILGVPNQNNLNIRFKHHHWLFPFED